MAFPNPIVVGEQLYISGIHSVNYIPGVSGWRIGKDGSAQFSSIVIGSPSFPNGIDGSDIKDGTVGNSKISGLDGSKLSGTVKGSLIDSLDGSKLSGEINGALLKAWSIQPNKVAIQPDNLIGDPWFDSADYWFGVSGGAGSMLQSTDKPLPGHTYSTKIVCSSGSNYAGYPNPVLVPSVPYGVPAEAGQTYLYVAWVYCDDNTAYADARVSLRAYARNTDGTLYNGTAQDYPAGTFPTKQWVKMSGLVTLPAGSISATPRLTLYGATDGEVFYVGEQSLYLAVGVDRLMDGAITQTKIADGSITTPKLAANAVVAGTIAAGAIDGFTITGATLTAVNQFTVGTRTAWNDTNQGWWFQGDGYANVNDPDGNTFLKVNPKDATRYFQVGDPSSGAYLNYTVNTQTLTVAGEILTDKDNNPRLHMSNSLFSSGPYFGIAFETQGKIGEFNPAVYAYSDDKGDWGRGTLVLESKQVNNTSNRIVDRSQLYLSPTGVFMQVSNTSGSQQSSISLGNSAGFRLQATAGPANIGSSGSMGLASSADLNLSGSTIWLYGVAAQSSSYATVMIGAQGRLWQASSLSALKKDQQPIPVHYGILDVPGMTWVDKTVYDEGGTTRSAGVIAEQVADVSATYGGIFDPLLQLNDDGALTGVAYDRIIAYLIGVVADMNKRLTVLDGAAQPVKVKAKRKFKSAKPNSLLLKKELFSWQK